MENNQINLFGELEEKDKAKSVSNSGKTKIEISNKNDIVRLEEINANNDRTDNELEIILSIMEKSGTNEKIDTIRENEDNERLKEILFYTFNPLLVFGISSKKIEKEINLTPNFTAKDIVDLLKYLKENNTGTDQVICNVQAFLKAQNGRYKDILIDIITKSLTLGINAKSINKVWDNFIPDYEVQQGERLENNIDKLIESGRKIIVTQKYDGQRCSARVENHNVIMYSRNGKIYEGMHQLESELSKLEDGMYDGELLINVKDERDSDNVPTFIKKDNSKHIKVESSLIPKEEGDGSGTSVKGQYTEFNQDLLNKIYAPKESKELFKDTASLVNSDLEEKYNVNIWLYDMTPLENFDKMEDYDVPVEIRKKELRERVAKVSQECPHLKETKYLYEGEFDNNIIQDLLKQVIDLHQEGMMINVYGSPYEFNRSKNMLKVKQMYPIDLRVIDVLEGSGANKGKAGALLVNYKGNSLKVGSGLTKELREKFWEDKESIIGKIITIKYFEETTNKKDNSKSLRFPIFLEVREDKDEESYN